MKKIIKILLISFCIPIIIYIQLKFLGNYYLKTEILTSIITFLSIIFGFYITSLAIFVTSKYVSDLYKITDENNKSLTLLQILIKKYKFGLNVLLVSIAYFILIQFYINQNRNNEILFSNKVLFPFFILLLLNFLYSYFMLNTLIKIIIQEAKRKANNVTNC